LDAGVPVIQVVGSDESSRFVPLGIGKSVVLDLPRDIKDVLVADPTIANAVVRSSRAPTSSASRSADQHVLLRRRRPADRRFRHRVKRDLGGLQAILRQGHAGRRYPRRSGRRRHHAGGSVATPAQAQQAYDLANRVASSGGAGGFSFGGGGDAKVINNIVVRGRDQVMIKVTVAEVQRDVIKQLGHAIFRLVLDRHGRGEFQPDQSVSPRSDRA
jgi:pilus assembly protein CpaC